jgi:hypothetical protein
MNSACRFFSRITKHNAPRFQNELSSVLDTLHSSKEKIQHITLVKWNTGFNEGFTMTFNLHNLNEVYDVEVLVRNRLNTINLTHDSDNLDKLDNEYLREKSEEFAKKN